MSERYKVIFRDYDPKVMARLKMSAPFCHCESLSHPVIARPDLSGRSNLVGEDKGLPHDPEGSHYKNLEV